MINSHCQPCRLLQRVVALILAVSMMGCASLRVVHPASGPGGAPVAGDELVVSLKGGGSIALKATRSTPEALVGVRAGEEVSIAWSDIDKVERREIDTMRTALAVVAVIGVLQLLRGLASAPAKLLGRTP